MEEEEEDQDTSIKGRLVALVNKIKGQPHKAEEKPTEKGQAIPCKNHLQQNAIVIVQRIHFVFVFEVHTMCKCVHQSCSLLMNKINGP